METTMTTMRITLPTSDTRFLKRLSGNMGWSLERASASEKSAAKIQMTKDEFCTKIRKSSHQKTASAGCFCIWALYQLSYPFL